MSIPVQNLSTAATEKISTFDAQYSWIPKHCPERGDWSKCAENVLVVVTKLSGHAKTDATRVEQLRKLEQGVLSAAPTARKSAAENLASYLLEAVSSGERSSGASAPSLFASSVSVLRSVPDSFARLFASWDTLQRLATHRHRSVVFQLHELLDDGIAPLCGEVDQQCRSLEGQLSRVEGFLRLGELAEHLPRLGPLSDTLAGYLEELRTTRTRLAEIGVLLALHPPTALIKHRHLDDSQARVRRPQRNAQKRRLKAPTGVRLLFPHAASPVAAADPPSLSVVAIRESAFLPAFARPSHQTDDPAHPPTLLHHRPDFQQHLADLFASAQEAEEKDPNEAAKIIPATFKKDTDRTRFHIMDGRWIATLENLVIHKVLELPEEVEARQKAREKNVKPAPPPRSYLLFRVRWTEEGRGGGRVERSVYRLSLPTTVLRHSLDWKRGGVDSERFWDQVFFMETGNPFVLPHFANPAFRANGVLWEDFKHILNHKFQCLAGASHGILDVRPISQTGLAHISTYLFGNLSGQDPARMFVTRQTFYQHAQYTKLRFGEWFYCMCFVVDGHLFHFWNSWLVWDFTSKETARRILREVDEAALMIKFSDTMLGTIIIAFRDPKGKSTETDFLRMDLGQMYQVRVDQSLYSTDLQPIKFLLRAADAKPIEISEVLEEGKNQRDYYRCLVVGQMDDIQAHPYHLIPGEGRLREAYPGVFRLDGLQETLPDVDSGLGSSGSAGRRGRAVMADPRPPPMDPAFRYSPRRNILLTVLANAKHKGRVGSGRPDQRPSSPSESDGQVPDGKALKDLHFFDFGQVMEEGDSGLGSSVSSVPSLPRQGERLNAASRS